MSPQQEPSADEQDPSEIDPIWTSSRTARQIYALGEVEKVSPSHTAAQHTSPPLTLYC